MFFLTPPKFKFISNQIAKKSLFFFYHELSVKRYSGNDPRFYKMINNANFSIQHLKLIPKPLVDIMKMSSLHSKCTLPLFTCQYLLSARKWFYLVVQYINSFFGVDLSRELVKCQSLCSPLFAPPSLHSPGPLPLDTNLLNFSLKPLLQ